MYVSGPLHGAADLPSARALYFAVAAALEATGHEAYVPHLRTDPQTAPDLGPEDVYDRDVAALLSADAVVAHVGAPSTGVGAELAIAHQAGLRLVGVRRQDESVSRFAHGLIGRAGGTVVAFDGHADLPRVLGAALAGPHAPDGDRPGAQPGRATTGAG